MDVPQDKVGEDKVSQYTGASWSKEGVAKLIELWREGVSPKVIAATLRRSEADVHAKAAELRLPEHIENS
jgi:hypothetical protein